MARYVFITGGVVSSLGKGIAAAARAGLRAWETLAGFAVEAVAAGSILAPSAGVAAVLAMV